MLEASTDSLYCSCPYAQRATNVLHEKDISHRVELFDKEHKPEDFLDLFAGITANPKARATVPTMTGRQSSVGNIIGAFVKGLGLSNPSFDGSLSSNRDLRDKESFGAT